MGMGAVSFGGHGAIMEERSTPQQQQQRPQAMTSAVSTSSRIAAPQDASITRPTELPGFDYVTAFVPITARDVDNFQLFNRDKRVRQSRNPIEYVFVAFVKGDPSKCKSWWKYALNSVVNVSGDYTHCEIVFKFRSGHYVACTIYMDEVVKMEIKPYKLIKWRTFGIQMSEDQAQDAYGYCLGQLGKNFNMTGIVWSFVPLIGPTIAKWYNGDERTFFCTELVLRALQAAVPHIFLKPQYDPQTTTPTMLKHILEQENMIVINTLENIDGLQLRLDDNV